MLTTNCTQAGCLPGETLDLSGIAYPNVATSGGTSMAVPEYDMAILCEPGTDTQVIVTTMFNPGTPPIVEAFLLDGSVYGGVITDLTPCAGASLESDPLLICIGGNVQAHQWVVKDEGQPTGSVFYTDLSGAAIAAPAAGTFTVGACATDVFDYETICGTNMATGATAFMQIAINVATGARTVTYYQEDGVTPMTNSADFNASKEQVNNESEIVYATNTTDGDAEFGRVAEVRRTEVYRDGVLDAAATTYWNMNVQPPVDVTALVTAAPFQLAAAPVRKKFNPAEQLDVTGAAEVALAAIPTFATYAEIYIDASADDTNIRWTKDGTAPADDNGEQESTGTTIRLLDRDEIDGFRALTIDGSGNLDPALVASLTVDYWNVAPDED